MKVSAEFWHRRVALHGHTGWADPVIYAYDQAERLRHVRECIQRWRIPPGRVLDFGCGSGDFGGMLAKLGFGVVSYDPYVRPKRANGCTVARDFAEISTAGRQFDLILSVTALDHILDFGELVATMRGLSSILRPTGYLFMIEYALDPGEAVPERRQNHYQALRRYEDWCHVLTNVGLRPVEVRPISDPVASPSKGFRDYTGCAPARARRKWARIGNGRWLADPLLAAYARKLVDRLPQADLVVAKSALKLIASRPILE